MAVAAAAGDPDWLLADRLAGLRGFEALPIESNRLYTPYVDLRNAHLSAVRPYAGPAAAAGRSPRPARRSSPRERPRTPSSSRIA